MKMKKSRSVALCLPLAATLLMGVAVRTGWTQETSAAMTGLNGVGVRISVDERSLGKGNEKLISNSQVRTDVEGWLRQEKIKILSEEERKKQVGNQELVVGLTILPIMVIDEGKPTPTGNYAVYTRVSLQQDCRLVNNAAEVVHSDVFGWDDLGLVGDKDMVRQKIHAFVTDFAKVYHASNVH